MAIQQDEKIRFAGDVSIDKIDTPNGMKEGNWYCI